MLRRAVLVLLGCAPLGAFAAPVPKEDDAARVIRIYGIAHDPDKGTEFKPSGDTLHVILPQEKRLLERWRNFFNAPRVWREVRGDFTATVRVSFPIRVEVPPVHPFGDEARSGGGLVVWLDDENHLTVTRDEWVFNKTKMRERFRGDSRVEGRGRTDSENVAAAASGYVRVQRKGKRFEASYSTDGKKWQELNVYEAEWADTPKVGVVAENNFKAPFEVVFSEYKLTREK